MQANNSGLKTASSLIFFKYKNLSLSYFWSQTYAQYVPCVVDLYFGHCSDLLIYTSHVEMHVSLRKMSLASVSSLESVFKGKMLNNSLDGLYSVLVSGGLAEYWFITRACTLCKVMRYKNQQAYLAIPVSDIKGLMILKNVLSCFNGRLKRNFQTDYQTENSKKIQSAEPPQG